MNATAADRKNELMAQVAACVHERVEDTRASLAERFVREYYAHVALGDIAEVAPSDLAGAALSLWEHGQLRKPGVPNVRTYNPTAESNHWQSKLSVIEIVTDDMPFLVESVTGHLNAHGTAVHLMVHPIFAVKRDDKGALVDVAPVANGGDSRRESYMHVEVAEQPPERLAEITSLVTQVLADVRAAVEDFEPMRRRCAEVAEELVQRDKNETEGIAFLRWLLTNHFTFLGYRSYDFAEGEVRVTPDSGAGILRDERASVFKGLLTGGQVPEELARQDAVRITKTKRDSTVHRPVPMDAIGVKRFNEAGEVIGEHLFLGLFTSRAYGLGPSEIPMVRTKVDQVLAQTGFHKESFNHKTLVHILETYPRDELYQIDAATLAQIAMGILQLHERPKIAFFPRVDPLERFVSCLIFVPRDQYDTELRLVFQEILAGAFNGTVSNYYTRMTTEAHARLHVIIQTTPGTLPEWDAALIEARLIEAARSWGDRLLTALVDARGGHEGRAAYERFRRAFPSSYRDTFDENVALTDIAHLEDALARDGFTMNLHRPVDAGTNEAHFKLYACGEASALSDVLPVLENMGFRVQREVPYRIRPAGHDGEVWIRDFDVISAGDGPTDLAAAREAFHEAFAQIWGGLRVNDGFNALVLRAALSAREVSILRAYCKYMRQGGLPFSQEYMERALAGQPGIARALVDLFEVRFEPANGVDRDAEARPLIAQIEKTLEGISSLDEDRILRSYLAVVEATLRTNYFQTDADGNQKNYISFKFDSHKVPGLPKPRPWREIFVYSVRMEGIHLRGGRVARGGLRWSDRLEDFRTEVLGLMKAQMVKNAVIVPVGSKGGFVVKQPPADRAALWDEVLACYRMLICGMLDLTDNISGDEIIPPINVLRRDDDDPYLVVAADKGTATFSDTANGIAREYGFWLDDAFASGGSVGYDHKKMGITARGAWESVKRHFREMGKDIQNEDFTCVGVGDMSGDVFGNGMLLSKHTRLIAAFNHIHIFFDPDPDAAKSFVERRRLFDMERSTWADYDEALISKGGGVWERSLKRIPVSPAMREHFGLEEEEVTPNELISAILKADVELLWLGGIGTYARATHESDAAAGDRANDATRITAVQIRAKVIGEGANLGLTQPARIEYAKGGGRLNTDAIDNSAGVDCSDHEVNIKILLGEAERANDLTRAERDVLLAEMTEEVGDLVLRDNYLQTQSITVSHQLGRHLLDRFARFIRRMERSGRLDRVIEFLPDDDELADRAARGTVLTRPELSTLLSYAKMELYEQLVASDLPDDPALGDVLKGYFPAPLQARFPQHIASHRLRREIIATVITNEMVNRSGIGFAHEVREKTGHEQADIARAYMIARSVFNIEGVWAAIEALDPTLNAKLQADMLADCGRLMERGTVWFLRNGGAPLDIKAEIKRYRAGVGEVIDVLDASLAARQHEMLRERAERFEGRHAPKALAHSMAQFSILAPALDVVRLADERDLPVPDVTRLHAAVATHFGFDWLRRAAGKLSSDTAWDKLAITALLEDVEDAHVQLTRLILSMPSRSSDAFQAIAAWEEERGPMVLRTEQILSELQAQGHADYQMLAVATRGIKAMIA